MLIAVDCNMYLIHVTRYDLEVMKYVCAYSLVEDLGLHQAILTRSKSVEVERKDRDRQPYYLNRCPVTAGNPF